MPNGRQRSKSRGPRAKSRGRTPQGGAAGPAGSSQRPSEPDYDRRAGAGGNAGGNASGRGRSRSRGNRQDQNWQQPRNPVWPQQQKEWPHGSVQREWPHQKEWPQQKEWPAASPAAAATSGPHAWAIPGYYKFKEEATQLKKKVEELEAASSSRVPSMFSQGMSTAMQYMGMRPPNACCASPNGFETQQAGQPMGGFPPLPPMPPPFMLGQPPAFMPGQPPVMFPPPTGPPTGYPQYGTPSAWARPLGGGAADGGQQGFPPPGEGGWRPCAGTLRAGGAVQYYNEPPQQNGEEPNRGPIEKSAVEITIDALLRRGILPTPAAPVAASADQRRPRREAAAASAAKGPSDRGESRGSEDRVEKVKELLREVLGGEGAKSSGRGQAEDAMVMLEELLQSKKLPEPGKGRRHAGAESPAAAGGRHRRSGASSSRSEGGLFDRRPADRQQAALPTRDDRDGDSASGSEAERSDDEARSQASRGGHSHRSRRSGRGHRRGRGRSIARGESPPAAPPPRKLARPNGSAEDIAEAKAAAAALAKAGAIPKTAPAAKAEASAAAAAAPPAAAAAPETLIPPEQWAKATKQVKEVLDIVDDAEEPTVVSFEDCAAWEKWLCSHQTISVKKLAEALEENEIKGSERSKVGKCHLLLMHSAGV